MVVVGLIAAFIAPFFVNWDEYRSTFAEQAERVLGQPVALNGPADVSLLPMPRFVFNDVEIGGSDGQPLMAVERFEARVELFPLMRGEIRFAAVTLVQPKMTIVFDDTGRLNWRPDNASGLPVNPDSVVVSQINIQDGEITVIDDRTGAKFAFSSITTDNIDAPSLLGPWKVSGRMQISGEWTEFRIATGRVLESGDVRMTLVLQPSAPHLAGEMFSDGVLRIEEDGPVYEGDFAYRKYRAPEEGADRSVETIWRMAGTYRLEPRQLRVASFTVNEGSGNTPFGISGAMSVNFGGSSRFAAEITSQQIELDRPVEEGGRANVQTALSELVRELAVLPVPTIAGRVGVSIPAIVVGGGVIQRLAFDALPADGAWQIRDLEVQFPGRTELVVDGSMRSGDAPRFFGTANLVSSQPEVFTSWLTGGALQGSRLSRLDVSSRISIARGEVVAEGIEARLGDAEAGGRIVWEGKDAEAASTRLEAELAVDRVDFDDLAAFGRLVLGGAVGAPGELADRIAIDFSANTIESDDVALRDVSVVAGLADDTLTVETIQIGDVAGASLSVDQGRIAAISTRPSGEIVGRFQAETLEGVGRLVATLWPDSEAATWLEDVGATLVPLGLTARFSADAGAEGERFEVELEGAAAGSEIRATTLIAGRPMDWRSAASKTSLTIGNPVSAALAQQFGLPVRPLDTPLPGRIEVAAEGVVADSLSLTVGGEFAGARLDATGTLAGIESDEPGFTGSFDLESADIDPILLIAGKTLPGVGLGTPASLSGAVRIAADGAEVTLEPSTVGDREIVGNLTLRRPAGDWSFGGSLDVDSVDLPWLASLALGVAPEPTGEAAAPWPTLSFGQPVLGEVRGGLELSFGRLGLGPGLELTDGRLQVRLQPAALGLELLDGGLAGGTASGQVTIRNTVGDAAVRGEIGLSGANLAALSWSNGDQPAIDGLLELAADFETTGGSVAALAGSLTGGGEFSVADGVIRKLDPTIFERAITETERGFDLTPGNLARMFDEASGEAALDFEAASGRFAIVAGEVRARNVAVDAGPVSLGGGGTIDMADLSLTSAWTMAFQPDDDLLADVTPTLGISFAGPVAAPVRTVNTEPLARYLSLRTLEQLERDREATLERRQIDRLARLQQIYADSVLAQEAAAREAAEAARLDAERRAQEEAERQKAEEDAARAASERDPTGIFSAPLPPPNPSIGESPPAGPSGGN